MAPSPTGSSWGATLGGRPRVLVIGSIALFDAVVRSLPGIDVVHSQTAVDGVWQAGQEQIERVIIGIQPGKTLQVIRGIRAVAPHAQLVVACSAAHEPAARATLEDGADEYVLEPLSRGELEAALKLTGASAPARLVEPPTPDLIDEYSRFGEILRSLSDGPQATLDRLASLVQDACDAQGALLQIDALSAASGQPDPQVLAEPILRGDQSVGQIALGPRRFGSYSARTVLKLREYARLVEVTLAQACEREHWQTLAFTDDLSGLHNRRYFERTVDELIQRAARQRARLTLLLFDLDHFKSYNDRFGHATGDELIREVAVLLRRCTREGDLVARFGGDEFAMVFVDNERPRVLGSQHPAEPIALAERFQRALAEHEFHCLGPDRPGPVTISGGLACYPWDGGTRDALIGAADQALLTAKRTGKNRIQIAGAAEDLAQNEQLSPRE